MKQQKPLEIKEDPGLKARRLARLAIGPAKPQRAIEPKTSKPPRHKKKAREEDVL